MSVYVSDPMMWKKFYENISSKHFNPYEYKKKKTNGIRTYSKSFLIPVNKHAAANDMMKQVSSVTATVDRAKVNLEHEKANEIPHVKPKLTKKRKINQSLSTTEKRTRVAHKKQGAKSKSVKRAVINRPATKKKRKVKRTVIGRNNTDIWSKR